MRRYLLVCFAFLGLGFANTTLRAQTAFNEYVTQPDVWRPANISEPGVDAKGDLNLSIPVLTVPGRNGLDFQITFSYTSGIKATQQSSWVGLGWSFDPGSITRDVQSTHAEGQAHTVDFTDLPAHQPDMYYVTLPGGGFSMTRRGNVGSVYPPPNSVAGDFIATQWKPWKIEYNASPQPVTVVDPDPLPGKSFTTARYYDGPLPGDDGQESKADFEKFLITDLSGTRYLFAAPTLASHTVIGPNVTTYETEHYVSTWRLVAILGADYPHPPWSAPENDALGSWIRFEYSNVMSRDRPHAQWGVELNQARYLEAIITPTHKAVFTRAGHGCEANCDNWANGGNIYSKLESITLQTHPVGSATPQPIRVADLKFADHDNAFHNVFGKEKRLKLQHIDYQGDDGTPLPGYSFQYWGSTELGVSGITDRHTDDFGYVTTEEFGQSYGVFNTHTTDAALWSLEEIVYPTGGWSTITYENDWIHLNQNNDAYIPRDIPYRVSGVSEPGEYTITETMTRQGGVRVKKMTRYSGLPDDVLETTFTYGAGRVSGIPSNYWARGTVPQNADLFLPNSRGKAAVYYTSVRRENSDGTFSLTKYTTDNNYSANIERINATLFQQGNTLTIIQDNAELNWGIPFHTTSGELYSERQRHTSTNHDLSKGRLVRASGIDETYVWWRLANSVRMEATSQEGIYTEKIYSYDPKTGLIKRIEESAYDEPTRVTRRYYAYEFEPYSVLREGNVLSAVVYEDFSERVHAPPIEPPEPGEPSLDLSDCTIKPLPSGEPDDVYISCPGDDNVNGAPTNPDTTNYVDLPEHDLRVHRATATTWSRASLLPGFDEVGVGDALEWTIWKPHRVYHWRAEQPGTPPSFNMAAPPADDAPDWLLQTTLSRYDHFGQIVEQTDAIGTKTRFFYGTIGDAVGGVDPNCENPSSGLETPFRHSYLTCIEVESADGLTTLRQEIDYDATGRITAILAPQNGANHSFFDYDPFGRLKKVRTGPDASTTADLSTYTYDLRRDADGKASPTGLNAITTQLHTGATSYETTSIVDGLGKGVQEQATHNIAAIGQTEYIVTAQHHDINNRLATSYKPVVYDNLPAGRYVSNFAFEADTQYPNAFPYTEVESDGFGRPLLVTPLGSGPNGAKQYLSYESAKLDPHNTPRRTFIATTTDEDGNITRSYTDAFGQTYLTQAYLRTPAPAQTPEESAPQSVSISGNGTSTGDPHLIKWSSPSVYETHELPQSQLIYLSQSAPHPDAYCRLLIYDLLGAERIMSRQGCDPSITFVGQQGHRYGFHFMVGVLASKPQTTTVNLSYTVSFKKDGYIERPQTTGFVYDVAGNLTKVMPPNYYAPPTGSPENWATTYRYNTLGQLVAKSTPDADGDNDTISHNEQASTDPDFVYAYDRTGNLRFSQDPNQRKEETVAFTAYDGLGRPVVTGLGRPLTDEGDTVPFASLNPLGTPSTCDATDTPFAVHHNNLECAPNHWLQVSRYDAFPDLGKAPWSYFDWSNGRLPATLAYTKGRLAATAFRTEVDGAADEGWLLTLYSYDAFGRIAQVTYDFGEGLGVKQIDYQYDLQGAVTSIHYQSGEADAFHLWYTYDSLGRLTHVHSNTKNDSAPASGAVTEACYDYYTTSQVKRLTLGATDACLQRVVAPLDYSYHIRDWLEQINDPDAPGDDLFATRLHYESAATLSGGTAYHNGNIGAIEWTTDTKPKAQYVFSYDGLNRLVKGMFSDGVAAPPAFSLENVSYDPNGNITSLWRHQQTEVDVPIDYVYASGSNRLITAMGSVQEDYGQIAYTYDPNGNVVTRGSTSMEYDHRNLPTAMTLGANKILRHRYDAAGQRISKVLLEKANTCPPDVACKVIDASYYVRGVDGQVLAVYNDHYHLQYWNILAGGLPIGRVERTYATSSP